MSITSGELKFYGSLSMPTGNTGTMGGAIDTSVRVIFDDASIVNSFGSLPVAVVSTLGGDTSTFTLWGRTAPGVLVSESFALAGTAPVTGTLSVDRILMVSGAHNGTLTVRQGGAPNTVFGTMESGVNTLRRPFFNVVADAAGGSNKVFYEKTFLKNTNATLTLTSAAMGASAAGMGTLTTFGIASGYNDVTSVTSRLDTIPTGVGPFSNTGRTIVDGNLAASGTIGTWLQLTLNAGTAAQLGTYTISVSGNSI